jgi:PAS domain S-box-containing protein
MESEAAPIPDDVGIRYRLKTEELLGRISASAIKVEDLPAFINWALGEIGKTMGFSRLEITELDPKNQTLNGKYQWVSEGVESSIEKWKNIQVQASPTGGIAFLDRKHFMFENAREHPFPMIREILLSGGTESILGIPIYKRDPYGILAFETVGRSRKWLDEDIRLLTEFAHIIGTVIEKAEAETERNRIFDLSPDMIGVADFRGYLIHLNPAWQKLLGWTMEELKAKLFLEFIHPDDREPTIKIISDLTKGELIYSFENRFLCKDGFYKWISWNSSSAPEQGLIYFVARDVTVQKQMDEALQERDTQFKKLSAFVPGMIFQFMRRPDGTYCVPFSSEGIKNIFGCTPKDVSEDFSPIAKAILPEDLKGVFDDIEYSLKHLTPWQHEYRVQIPGQPIKWILGLSTPEKLTDGNIIWYGYNTDITESKLAEETVRKSEKKYRMLVDGATEAILVTQDGLICLVNPMAVKLTGFSEQELISASFLSFIHPEDRAIVSENYQKRVRGEEVTPRYAVRILSKDGSVKWVETSAVRIEWEGRPATLGFVMDITDRILAEERLQESEEGLRKSNAILQEERDRAQHYLDDVRAIIVNLDRGGNVTLINRRGCEILGLRESDIIGKNWFENFLPADNRPEVKRVFNELMDDRIENIENYDNPVLSSDGNIRTISWHNALLRDESGRIIGTLSAGEDISDRLQMEMDLKAATETLRGTNTSLIDAKLRSQTYFDFLAHDIANILSPILAYAELMSKGDQYPPEVVSFTEKIVDQAQKATSLIHNLRKLEMLEDKNLPDMNIVDIKRIFSFVENSIRRKYPEKKPTFTYHLPEEIPIKSRGGEYIDFVIRHIFDNAVRHSRRDDVNIDVRIDMEGENDRNKFWQIIIEDDGPGISDRLKKDITTPLDPTKRYSRGVASSLAFCSAAVVGIGGELQIEDRVPNDQGKGTRVTVWIPVYD